MKTLLNIFAIALLSAGIPESRADTAASAKEPQLARPSASAAETGGGESDDWDFEYKGAEKTD